ncbi:MAG: AAA family ATPase, partial [Candidatus Sumerlaeota bacterium]|nr:AAA family ATPase [Candidatus Sumerlaeota bacterium]
MDNVLEALVGACFYLTVDRNRYHFSLNPNINRLLTDRRAAVQPKQIDERLRKEIETCFRQGPKELDLDRRFFPTRSNDVPDRPALTLVVMGPDMPGDNAAAKRLIESIVRECGASGRTFKSALLFSAPVSTNGMADQARDVLAWEDIDDDEETKRRMDGAQRRMLDQKLGRAKSDLREAIWRAYRLLFMLGTDNTVRQIDFGALTSSMAPSLVDMIVNWLVKYQEISSGVGPNQLLKYWPPACAEWSTKAVRDAFCSSPLLPRLLRPESIRRTIADGVSQGALGYGSKDASGQFKLERFAESLSELEVEISDDVFIVTGEEAKKRKDPPKLARIVIRPDRAELESGEQAAFSAAGFDQYGQPFPVVNPKWQAVGGAIDAQGLFVAGDAAGVFRVQVEDEGFEAAAEIHMLRKDTGETKRPGGTGGRIRWGGVVPPQKWMNFYTKVVSPFARNAGLNLKVELEVPMGKDEIQGSQERIKTALRELGLEEMVDTEIAPRSRCCSECRD